MHTCEKKHLHVILRLVETGEWRRTGNSLLFHQFFCFAYKTDHKCAALARHWSHVDRIITWCAHIYDFIRKKKPRECRVLEHIPAIKFKFSGKVFGGFHFISFPRDVHSKSDSLKMNGKCEALTNASLGILLPQVRAAK